MTGKNATDSNPLQEVVVTRQPIFDKKKDVFAYELLFNPNFQDSIKAITSKKKALDDSSFLAADSMFINGLKRLGNGKRVVIHFNQQMLLSDFPLMFPNNLLGIEIQEDTDPENKILLAVEKIKKAGYLVVMTDNLFNSGSIDLVKMADIVGVDFRSQGIRKRFSLFEGEPLNPRFLAKSVETPADFDLAVNTGYHYFQGDFFSRGDIVSLRNIPSYKMNLMRILKEISKPSLQVDNIEKILQHDVAITYKLLRFINSAFFGFRSKVQSIRHALALLGEIEIRKWLSFIVLSSVGTDKPAELMRATIIRARFCESLAVETDFRSEQSNCFLMGMFSMAEAFLDRPMKEILTDLPLAEPLKSALLGKPNHFRDILDVVIDYEKGDWIHLQKTGDRLKLPGAKLAALYLDAVEWEKFL